MSKDQKKGYEIRNGKLCWNSMGGAISSKIDVPKIKANGRHILAAIIDCKNDADGFKVLAHGDYKMTIQDWQMAVACAAQEKPLPLRMGASWPEKIDDTRLFMVEIDENNIESVNRAFVDADQDAFKDIILSNPFVASENPLPAPSRNYSMTF